MIVKREHYYIKAKGKYPFRKTQQRKITMYLLLGIIPVFINVEILKGDCF